MATQNEAQEPQWFVCDGLVFTPGSGARWNCMTQDGTGVSVIPVGGGVAWDWSAQLDWWVGAGTGQAPTRDEAVRAAVQALADAGLGLEGLPRTDNEEAYGLARRIQAALSEHFGQPFHLTDSGIDAAFRYWTAKDAVTKADESGITRFAYKEGESFRQVDKVDGQWWVRGETTPPWNAGKKPGTSDKALSSLQEELDRDSLLGIQVLAEQRWSAGRAGVVDPPSMTRWRAPMQALFSVSRTPTCAKKLPLILPPMRGSTPPTSRAWMNGAESSCPTGRWPR